MTRILPYFLLIVFSSSVFAAPSSEYWSFWDQSDSDSKATVDHKLWQEILDEYLDSRPDGALFRYNKVTEGDGEKLDAYIRQLTAIDPRTYNKNEQKAYWINLYNALTVDLILEHYPVLSITKIGPFFSFGPWDQTITRVASQDLTLNDIEHRILRPLWRDKRIHYAVNCASLGCPDLAAKAFTGSNTDELLEAQTQRFIQQEKGVSWVDGKLVLSRIYDWYGVDFGSSDELMLHIKQYSSDLQKIRLRKYTGIPHYQYNWNLNELK